MVTAICLQREVTQPTDRNSLRKRELAREAARVLRLLLGFPLGSSQASLLESVAVLILAQEELISALLGLLVESTGHGALFANAGEQSADAIRRLDPGVVIVDCDHRDCTDDMVQAAREVGARLILFSASREPDYVRRAAARSRSRSFTFPIEPPELDLLIRDRVA